MTELNCEWTPRQVVLFSGQMIDVPDRQAPRFPNDQAGAAGKRIADALDELRVGPDDLALCQAAAGGDLLFLEACQKRGVRCQVQLPFPEPEFIEHSILRSSDGKAWRERYFVVKQTCEPILIMADVLGPLPQGVDPYERCNLWLIDSALACGINKVQFVCLWDGAASDAPSGTAHMFNEIKRHAVHVTWIDTRTL